MLHDEVHGKKCANKKEKKIKLRKKTKRLITGPLKFYGFKKNNTSKIAKTLEITKGLLVVVWEKMQSWWVFKIYNTFKS